MLIQDYLDICDPVLTFDRFMGEIELEKYLKNIPQHYTGRFRYDPVSMLKTVLFGFMANGYISLRELEDQCKVNLRFMYLMDHQTPSYHTFGHFYANQDSTYGFYPKYPVADAGYGSYNNYIFCEQHGMKKYMKFPMFKKETTDKKYHEDPFRAVNFPIGKDGIMRCPNGKKLQLPHRIS